MNRRQFILGVSGAILACSGTAAQQSRQARVIGILVPYPESDAPMQARVRAFRQDLAKLGWAEGSGIQFDVHLTTDNMDRVRAAAADLVALKPDVIVVFGDRAIHALAPLTRSIPIVALGSELAGSGFVESLARPGGNVTGFSAVEFSVVGKMVETLKQMAPGISRIGMIYNSDNPVGALYLQWFKAVAPGLAAEPINLPVHGVADLEHVIENLAEQPNGAFIVPPDVTISALATEITALAARYGVPAVYSSTLYARRGGLASYGTDYGELWRGLASYVNRILRGEKPGDLPVQQPTSYQLVINLKTAKALGLDIPPKLLAFADEVIE